MKKVISIFSFVMMALLVVSCTPQPNCEKIINSILRENRTLSAVQIQELKEQDFNRIGSIFPKFKEGNRGINPSVSYFVINNVSGENQYYYVAGGMYTEEWYGPYFENIPSQCFLKEE